MQLASKMRFISAQLIALLDDDLYLRSASHANAMAARLRTALEAGIADGSIRGSGSARPTQANGVFAILPPARPTGCASTSGSTTGTRAGRGALDVRVRHHGGTTSTTSSR